MARATLTTEPSRVYVGMLIVTALAMVVGITCMVLEAGEYDWEQKPGTTLKVDLPKEPAAIPAGNAAAPVEPAKPAVAVKPEPKIETPTPVTPVTVVPNALPPILLPPVAVVEKKPETKPEVNPQPAPASMPAKPAEPFPSPLLIPGR